MRRQSCDPSLRKAEEIAKAPDEEDSDEGEPDEEDPASEVKSASVTSMVSLEFMASKYYSAENQVIGAAEAAGSIAWRSSWLEGIPMKNGVASLELASTRTAGRRKK